MHVYLLYYIYIYMYIFYNYLGPFHSATVRASAHSLLSNYFILYNSFILVSFVLFFSFLSTCAQEITIYRVYLI